MNELVNNEQRWLDGWFERVKLWSLFDISQEKFTWLKIFGIPLLAWNEYCFKTIGDHFGCYIYADKHTLDRSCLEAARICVTASDSKSFNDLDILKVNGQSFWIYVSEENWRANPEWRMCGKLVQVIDGEGEDSSNVECHRVEEDEEGGWSNSLEVVEETRLNFISPYLRQSRGSAQKMFTDVCRLDCGNKVKSGELRTE
ncbi:hypothetical protein SLA2020_016770 [Shorea laevis]